MRALALLAFAASCGSSDCPTFIGDPAQAPAIDMVTLDAAFAVHTAGDGSELALIRPPQGGKIVLVGARARNVCAGPIQVTGAVTDLCTGRVVGLESRTVLYVAAADGGVADVKEPAQISSYANVAVCPNNVAARDLDGEPYRVTVTIQDKLGRVAEKVITATPVCAEPEDERECRCTCRAGYANGDTCAGFPDAGPPVDCPADGGMP
jgi:hypothetical protein